MGSFGDHLGGLKKMIGKGAQSSKDGFLLCTHW